MNSSIEESTRLADELTGEFVPLCVADQNGAMAGTPALHFWTKPEFMKVCALLNEVRHAA